SLSLTTLARNSPVALAIAVTAFPDEPLIALALVIGPLIELPVLAFVSQVLLLIKKKRQYA
ncbi:arsenic resistance protein, partial [Bacillus cereus]|nr:arsenic resistance protein [Bacillus cereus]